tara:strand:- start:10782 stop:11450 length:669 start_codon:yes stop_codon:yes gene_type:complete
MRREEYFLDKLDDGLIHPSMLVKMTELWQETHGLEADGYFGPLTAESFAVSEPTTMHPFGLSVLMAAIADLGRGEEGGNNSGEYVEMLLGKEFDGDDDNDGAWCAAAVTHWLSVAAESDNVSLQFNTSFGAKALYGNILRSGVEASEPCAGDIVCWDRGTPGSWQGHIGVVERFEGGILHTIEGNKGGFPSKVRRFRYDLSKESRLEGFARFTDASVRSNDA